MLKRLISLLLAVLALVLLFGCIKKETVQNIVPSDGRYEIEVTMEGGTGKASIQSPTELEVKDGKMTARITWSSPHYDYMIACGEKLDAEIIDGHSVFYIPVSALDEKQTVTADTTAMSQPHEIEYTFLFDSKTLKPAN